MNWVWHWIVHVTGSDFGAPFGSFQPYDFLSGIAGLSLLSMPFVLLRKHNCEVHHCWRLGRHTTAAGHRVCRRHHPDDHLTPETVAQAHQEAQV